TSDMDGDFSVHVSNLFHSCLQLSGSLVLAVGLWLRFDPDMTNLLAENDAPEHFFIAVYILIGAGGVMMLVGFFGCFGAVRESQCLLGSVGKNYATVAAGVFVFLNKDTVCHALYQFEWGVVLTLTLTLTHYISLPHSTNVLLKYFQYCDKAIEDFYKETLFIIGYVGIGIAGIMIIGMIFSMVLCCAIRNSREII
uniref:Tetraspanin 2a n=1 Tax=Sinocyclocheilus rhinocerous TaxID=307959 RepID=A0A673M1R3_9TELE